MSKATTSHDLLFGLLALQVGLVDQGQLVAAFQAWTLEKGRRLADLLEERGSLDREDRNAVEALVARHIEKHGGDATKGLASVPAGRSTREKLAALGDPDLEATLGHVSSGRGSTEAREGDETASHAIGTETSDGQRFRMLRPHARGGLGAVFVALDAELNREVALKQILDHHADDPTSRQRFLLEAEVTGGLEHPGIVPVYGLGTYADGRPYYAMRFIRGDSLKEAIGRFHADEDLQRDPGRRSLELRKLLRRFTDVCNAIQYAHSRGVLHRDIKPGNIIVGKHGETLVVDWGLAKARGRTDAESMDERPLVPSSASGTAETLPGSALGTPAFMSPEQTQGDLERLGPQSDVYSLGATLYCLLTGRPPIENADVGAMLRAVQRGDFRPPRYHNPSLDRALEVVCLKAMALVPEDRYSSPRGLAEDVDRWLADEPVMAWTEPLPRRARRWMRRHRTAVAASAVALAAGVIGLGAIAGLQARANGRLREANAATSRALVEADQAKRATEQALSRSEILRQEAEASRQQAEATSRFLIEAFRSPDPNLDGRDVRVVDLLSGAGKALDEDFRGSEASRAALLHALGETYLGLGLIAEAVSRHQRALDLRERILGPDHPQTLESRNDLGWARFSSGEVAEALPLLETALGRREAVLGPNHPQTLSSRNDVAIAYRAAGRLEEAIALHERTLKGREAVLGPDHPETLDSCSNLAVAYRNAGRVAEAIQLLEGAIRRMQANYGMDHPLTLRASNNLAMAYAYARREPEALALHQEAYRRRRAVLGPDHPETLISRRNLATALDLAGRQADAIPILEEGLRLSLSKYGPDHSQTVAVQAQLARLYESLGRFAEAEPLRRRAVVASPKSPPRTGRLRAEDLVALGRNLLEQAKGPAAEPVVREALSILERDAPDDWPRFEAMSLLGDALLRRGLHGEAEPLLVAGYDGMKRREAQIPPPLRSRVSDAGRRGLRLYESWNRPEGTAAWKARLGLIDLPADPLAPP